MKLDVIELQVKNWKESLAWWTEKLGWKVIAQEFDHQFALLQGHGGAMVGLYGRSKLGTQHVVPYVRVKKIEDSIRSLRQVNVSVGKLERRHWGKRVRIIDPEGNILYFYEERT